MTDEPRNGDLCGNCGHEYVDHKGVVRELLAKLHLNCAHPLRANDTPYPCPCPGWTLLELNRARRPHLSVVQRVDH